MTEENKVTVPADPLEMADNLLHAYRQKATVAIEDPITFTVQRLGEYAAANLKQAGEFALVSIARDLRRIADHITRGDS